MDDAKKISSIWQLDEFKPLAGQFRARQSRLLEMERYYHGTMYAGVSRNGVWPLDLQINRAKKQIRVLFHPLAGAVQIDVALVPGGWLLDGDSQQHADAVRRVLKTSKWAVEADLYVHFGASMGQTTLKVVDDPLMGRVTIQALRPDSVLPVRSGAYDDSLRMAIIIGETVLADGRRVELAEVIDPETVRTFVAGQPMGVAGRPAEFENALGFVPIVDRPFIDVGHEFGEPTYAAAIEPLRGVNEQATDLDENIKRHIEPQWAAFIEDPETNAAALEKSGDNLWWFPAGSSIQALVASLDIPGVMQLISEVKSELKETIFELLILKLVGMNRIAVPAVEVQLAPLTMKIWRIRRSLDSGLVDALRMVARAYGTMRVADPALLALDDEMLGFDDRRPVMWLDALSRLQVEREETATQIGRQALDNERSLMGDGIGSDSADTLADEDVADE